MDCLEPTSASFPSAHFTVRLECLHESTTPSPLYFIAKPFGNDPRKCLMSND